MPVDEEENLLSFTQDGHSYGIAVPQNSEPKSTVKETTSVTGPFLALLLGPRNFLIDKTSRMPLESRPDYYWIGFCYPNIGILCACVM